MLRRDRNHPSVVMWSIGNEIPEQGREDGWKIAKRLTDICRQEDPTRPTTAAFNAADAAIKNHLAEQVDIPGFNYRARALRAVRRRAPAVDDGRRRDRLLRQLARRLPPADREVPEAPLAAS